MINTIINQASMSHYVRFVLANTCMPTLVLSKPSTFIGFQKKQFQSKEIFLHILKDELSPFFIEFHIMWESSQSYFVLLYNRQLLSNCLYENRNHFIFQEKGYPEEKESIMENILCLRSRYEKYQLGEINFPHELGMFLGYPMKDVEGYIRNQGKNYLLCGYWKVYSNPEQALKVFQSFREIREEAVKRISLGKSLEEMLQLYKNRV